MNLTRKFRLAATALILFSAGAAFAGGFSIYEAGARATALGGAFTATADDGSAIFYNPAGLSFLEGPVLSLNLMPIIPGSKFTGKSPSIPPNRSGETTDQIFPIPGLFYARQAGCCWTYGVGLYAPFGLGVQWENPETWAGRYSSYDVHLATVYVTPVLSYRVNEKLALALGADIAHQAIELNRYSGYPFGVGEDPLLNVIDTNLDGTSDLNVTPNFGLMYRPDEKWSFGVSYHHAKTMNYEGGDGVLKNVAPAGPVRDLVDTQLNAFGGTANSAGDHEFALATELDLPGILALGVAYQATPKLQVELDAVFWTWSNFESLVLDFDQPGIAALPDSIITANDLSLDTTILEKYDDAWQWRLGLDYDATPDWKIMAGYVRDASPQPTESMGPLLPDADRNDFSFGVQHTKNNWTLTASYMAVLFESRGTVENGEVTYFELDDADEQQEEIESRTYEAGEYDSIAHIFGFGVGYSF